MTCEEYQTLTSTKTPMECTRAERLAAGIHGNSCAACYSKMEEKGLAAIAQTLRDDPLFVILSAALIRQIMNEDTLDPEYREARTKFFKERNDDV